MKRLLDWILPVPTILYPQERDRLALESEARALAWMALVIETDVAAQRAADLARDVQWRWGPSVIELRDWPVGWLYEWPVQ